MGEFQFAHLVVELEFHHPDYRSPKQQYNQITFLPYPLYRLLADGLNMQPDTVHLTYKAILALFCH